MGEANLIAAALVKVAYTVLPAVTSIEEALAPGAPLVQSPDLRPGDPLAGSTVLKTRRFGWGDVEAVRADLVVENCYTFSMVTHFAIEPHGCIVDATKERSTIWSPVQHPAAIMGLGLSMMEQIILGKNGSIRNLGAPDYQIPTAKDMPLRMETTAKAAK